MQTIIIYADEGVSGDSLKHLIHNLEQEMDPTSCTLSRKDAKQLLSEDWDKTASLLIIPGGRDVFYHASLEGQGTDKIRSYIHAGGNYLGICAGAYFASGMIEFEKGGLLEVCGPRSLALFPGTAKGPALTLAKGKHAGTAKISWESSDCHVYFSSGCLFEKPENHPGVTALGHYLDLPNQPPAILDINFGQGKALLSGVHLEYTSHLINRDDPHLTHVIPTLERAEATRRQIFRSCLEKLSIPLKR